MEPGPLKALLGAWTFEITQDGQTVMQGRAEFAPVEGRLSPAACQKDGLQVEAEARHRDDTVGIHQVGTIVQLERIRRR